MTTLQDKLNQYRESKFTSRGEGNWLANLLDDDPPYLLMLWGIGGVGKTTIITQLVKSSSSNPQALANLDFQKTPLEVMTAWRQGFADRRFDKFDRALAEYRKIEDKARPALVTRLIKTSVEQVPFGVGSFAISAVGEDRVDSALDNLLTRPEKDKFLSGQAALTTLFIDALNEIASDRKVLLFLDTYEEVTTSIDLWLLDFLGRASSQVRFVIAGRDKLEHMNWLWNEWSPIIREEEIVGFTDREIRQYLGKWGVADEKTIQEIVAISGNIPWSIELVMELLQNSSLTLEQMAESSDYQEVQQKLVARLLKQFQQDQGLKDTIEVCSILRRFNQDSLQHLVGSPVNQHFRLLRGYSFFRTTDNKNFKLHDRFREIIEADYKSRSPQSWRSLQLRAADYYGELVQQVEKYGTSWEANIAEWFHHMLMVDEDRAMQEFTILFGEFSGHLLNRYCRAILDEFSHNLKNPSNVIKHSYYVAQIELALNNVELAEIKLREITSKTPTEVPLIYIKANAILCDIYHSQGKFDRAIEVLEKGTLVANTYSNHDLLGLLTCKAAEIYGSVSDLEASKKHAKLSEESLNSITDPFLAGRISLQLADVYTFRGDYDHGMQNIQNALRFWQEANNEYGMARAQITLSWIQRQLGQWQQSDESCRKSIAFFEEAKDDLNIGISKLNLGALLTLKEEHDDAALFLQDAMKHFDEAEAHLYQAHCLQKIGLNHIGQKDFSAAIEMLSKSENLLQQQQEIHTLGLSKLYLAIAWRGKGDLDKSNLFLAQAHGLLANANNRYGFAELHTFRCELAYDERDRASFRESFAVADTIVRTWNYKLLDTRLQKTKLLFLFHFLVEKHPKQVERISETISEQLHQTLQAAISYNPYVLDSVLEEVLKAMAAHIEETDLRPIFKEILEDAISVWTNPNTELGLSWEETEKKLRRRESAAEHNQTSLCQRIQNFIVSNWASTS